MPNNAPTTTNPPRPVSADHHAFGYLRISGKGQEDGDGLQRQRAAIERFAAAHGLEVKEYFQDIQTGKDEWQYRPGWQAMLAKLNGCRTIIVEKLDRVARAVLVSELILADLKKRGVTLLSTTGEDSSEDEPERVMFRQMLAVFAQFERASIVLKLRSARDRMKHDTGRCEGRKPYGHHAGEAAVLARMVDLRNRSLSHGAIAAQLNAENIRTRYGGEWIGATVRKILARIPSPGDPVLATEAEIAECLPEPEGGVN